MAQVVIIIQDVDGAVDIHMQSEPNILQAEREDTAAQQLALDMLKLATAHGDASIVDTE